MSTKTTRIKKEDPVVPTADSGEKETIVVSTIPPQPPSPWDILPRQTRLNDNVDFQRVCLVLFRILDLLKRITPCDTGVRGDPTCTVCRRIKDLNNLVEQEMVSFDAQSRAGFYQKW